MFCVQCGHKLADGDGFCGMCGAQRADESNYWEPNVPSQLTDVEDSAQAPDSPATSSDAFPVPAEVPADSEGPGKPAFTVLDKSKNMQRVYVVLVDKETGEEIPIDLEGKIMYLSA